MAFKHYNHLNVPDSWERYFTKYPQGMSILESLFEWVSQVDSMVDNQNKLNTNVEQFRTEIDAFVGRFDERLQTEVTDTLKDWQASGFLDVVISDGLQWQLDDFTAQLLQKASKEEVESLLGNISSSTPIFVLTIEEMIDTTMVYVLIDNGNVYAHDGQAFVNTGVKYTETGVSNRSIDRLKADFNGYIPKGYEFTRDALPNRARTSNVILAKGNVVKIDENFEFYLLKNESGVFIDYSATWEKEHVMTISGEFTIRVRKEDDSNMIVDDVKNLTNKFSVITEKTAIQHREIKNLLTTELTYITTANPSRVNTLVQLLKKGTTIDTVNTPFDFAIYSATGEEFYQGWAKSFTTPRDDNYYLLIRKSDNSSFSGSDMDQLRNQVKTYLPENFVQYKHLGALEKDSGAYYVSENGLNTNNGLTRQTPFKTIQQAIEKGAKTIYIESGNYVSESFSVNGLNTLAIICLPDPNNDEKHTARFINGNVVPLTYSNGKYTGILPLDTKDKWREVFITKTLTPENTTAYQTNWKMKTYNAILWQIDEANDSRIIKLEPVLSMASLNATVGSFFYDGSTVHINPTFNSSALKFVKTIDNDLLTPSFKNIGTLRVSGIEFLYYHKSGVRLENVSEYEFINCTFAHTSEGTGFVPQRSNGTLKRCYGYHNQQDAFGPVSTGNNDFIDCYGYFNGDDGVSHHQYTTGTIRGGEYHNNGKGGVIPTHHSKVNAYDVMSHNNKYGFSFREGNGQSVIHSGNVAYDNEIDIQVSGYKIKAYNCKYGTEDILSDNQTAFVEL